MIEYDLTKPTPIDFKDIEEGMLIMHKDEDKFFIGIARWESSGIWYERGGGYVADSAFQNYVFPKKPKPLPTENGARIMLTKNAPIYFGSMISRKAGATFTRNPGGVNWILDGYVDSLKPSEFECTEWVEVEVVPVDA